MKKYIIPLLIFSSLQAHSSEIDCQNAMTTYEMNFCANRETEEANTLLEKYLSKAKQKYKNETAVITSLVKSQDAWIIYRKAHCDAIYEIWSGGTIRGVMFGGCMLQLTKQRTHKIWNDYLTYMDSTPPMLPETK